MSRPTFDEALADPAPKIAAWEISPEEDEATISVFTLAGGGAKQVAWRVCDRGDVDRLTAELEAAGHRVGFYDEHCDLVWTEEESAVSVWDAKARILVADAHDLRLANGRVFPRNAFDAYQSFVDEELLIDRGVRGRLANGNLVELIYVPAWGAGADPSYGRNELINETGWTGAIASALARWGGADYESWLP